MLIRQMRRVEFFKPKDGQYADMYPHDDPTIYRCAPALPRHAPFTDIIRVRVAGRPQYFLAEVVGAPGGDSYLSTGEAAALLGVTERTVRNWAQAGRLASKRTMGGDKRPGSWKVSLESVRSLMDDASELHPGPAPTPQPPARPRREEKTTEDRPTPGQLTLEGLAS